MDVHASVRALVTGVSAGRILEVLDAYYAEDVVIVDNFGTERIGLAALREQEARFLGEVELHAVAAEEVLVDGDRVTISWVYDVTPAGGSRGRTRCIVIQTWGEGRVRREIRYQV